MTADSHLLLRPFLDRVDDLVAAATEIGRSAGLDPEQQGDVDRITDAGRVLEERLRALASKAAAAQGAKRLRHDLRTPLNHVIGYGEMLQDELLGADDDPARVLLARVLHRARQILEGIDDLVEDVLSGGSRATPLPPAARTHPLPAVVRTDAATGRILVADDNDTNAQLLVRRLEPLGHAVVTVPDGRQALARLRAERFDLVLLDIMMPEVDGLQVLGELKRDDLLRHLPVIMITSLDEVASVARCIELGAADYLTKPFESVLLQARISACLEAKRLRDRQVEYLARIEQERQRANDLLRVILPDPIVEELARTDTVTPRRYENVGVLFCDIVGFTRYCDQRRPEEVLPWLQRLVEAYEEAMTRHRMQKIKTIGDGFMAVAGLLDPVEEPVVNCVRCAEEMVRLATELDIGWQVRVGVHVGPVVAGVLGRRQFQFDLWGDTVNTAARVESYGLNGRITLSAPAFARIEPFGAQGRRLGLVEIKGKGRVELVEFLGFAA